MGLSNNLGKLSNMITSTGSAVGIAQTSPAYTLDVTGTGRFTSTLLVSGAATFSSSVGIGTSTVPAKLTIYTGVGGAFPATSGTTQSNGLVARYKDTSNACIDYGTNGGSGGWLQVTNITDLSSAYPFLINPNGGNVGIGTTSPQAPLDVFGTNYDGKYTLNLQSTADLSADNGGGIYFGGKYTSTVYTGWAGILGRKDNATSGEYGGYMAFYTRTHGSPPAERMRITSGGSVCINSTRATAALVVDSNLNSLTGIDMRDTGTTGGAYIYFQNSSGNQAGIITHSGTTSITYTSTSDYRLKENVKTIENGLDRVLSLKPVTYTWIDTDNEQGEGFLAHELQEIVPLAVVGQKDELKEDGTIKPQSIDNSRIVPILVKAIQEQNQTIQELNERLNKAGL